MGITLTALFITVSQSLSLPPGLMSAICYTESRHNVKAINYHDGDGDSLGNCQIKLASARFVGYRGDARRLMQPEANVLWASKYFRYQLFRYNGDVVSAISAYNAGTARKTNLEYVRKVLTAWSERK